MSGRDSIDEKKIIADVLAGDTEAFAELVFAYQARIRILCASHLHNMDEADDAAQAAFLKAFKALGSFKGEAAFSTWLSHIATNYCMDLLRAKSRHATDSLDKLLEQKGDSVEALFANESSERVYTREDLDLLGKVLASLPEEDREILMLREVEELSYDEIASKLQCSLDAVKGRLKRVRARLGAKGHNLTDTLEGSPRP